VTPAGWLFMGTAWAIVTGLLIYTFGRLLFGESKSR